MKTLKKTAMLATVLTFLALSLLAGSANAANWFLTDNGAKIWNPNPVEGETATWTGDHDKDGYATGYGVLRWFEGGKLEQTYRGPMVKGNLHGRGIYTWIDGSSYSGDFVKGVFQGLGILKVPGTGTYGGEFVNDKMEGKGIFKFADGGYIEGTFSDGQPNGKCIHKWANGASYEGNFLAGKRAGKGIFKFPDGSYYEGDFLDDLFNGQGTLYHADGTIEKQGMWVKGEFVSQAANNPAGDNQKTE